MTFPNAVVWCNICNAFPAEGRLLASMGNEQPLWVDACQDCVIGMRKGENFTVTRNEDRHDG